MRVESCKEPVRRVNNLMHQMVSEIIIRCDLAELICYSKSEGSFWCPQQPQCMH